MMAVATVQHFLVLSAILFALGAAGVVLRRSVIVMFMSIELMLNAANLAFVAFAERLGNVDGQTMVFFVMTVAAAEAAVGLAIFLALFRSRETLNVDEITTLKG
jgi:NADH-quinone oxidoreductase subunit K